MSHSLATAETTEQSIGLDTYLSGPKYLIAPFEEENIAYTCECPSCHISRRYSYLLRWFWFGGFFLPLFWIANLILYGYVQWICNHEPSHRQLQSHELFTRYENEKKTKRSLLKLDATTMECIDSINGLQDDTVNLESGTQESESFNSMEDFFLNDVAMEVVRDHDCLRIRYKRWLARTLLGLIFYSTTIPLLIKSYTALN